jgi:glycosyltransferase involved in cell wall biosynthesis
MIDPRYDELGISINEIASYKYKNPNVRVVHRVNECDARKGTNNIDVLLSNSSKITDATIFVSKWMQDYFRDSWKTEEQHVIKNGVDKCHFRIKDPDLRIYDKMPPKKIIAHHWSNNEMKGFDIYEKIDKWIEGRQEYEFIYIGRDRKTFKNAKIIEPLFGKALGDELRQGDIYVSASRFDPGPNHVIEALACEIPTYVHRDGGGAVEFAGADAVYGSFEELILRITRAEYPAKSGWDLTWEECADLYFKIIDGK